MVEREEGILEWWEDCCVQLGGLCGSGMAEG